MNINERIDTVQRVIDIATEAITETEAILAKMKAQRMEHRVLLDDLVRQRELTVEATLDAVFCEPDADDLWEIDSARFGEELKYRVEGS